MPVSPTSLYVHHWIIQTISKEVQSVEFLGSDETDVVRVYESAGFGIVVAALQVIIFCFDIVVV